MTKKGLGDFQFTGCHRPINHWCWLSRHSSTSLPRSLPHPGRAGF